MSGVTNTWIRRGHVDVLGHLLGYYSQFAEPLKAALAAKRAPIEVIT